MKKMLDFPLKRRLGLNAGAKYDLIERGITKIY